MNTLELRHIRKSFDGQGVLEDISLSVPAGSVTAIIGPSGSGKSTLLRCATLLETADGGDIIYEGKYAAKDGVYAPKTELHAIRRYFGLVFQSYNLFPHFTLLKNVMDAPVQVQKRPAAEVREEAMALLGKMGLADRADAYPCQLSGGQQQRAAIARALRRADFGARPRADRRGPARYPLARRRKDDDGDRHARNAVCPHGRRPRRIHGRWLHRGGGHARTGHRRAAAGAHARLSAPVGTVISSGA